VGISACTVAMPQLVGQEAKTETKGNELQRLAEKMRA
jgi:hypothetical protein